MTTLHEDRSVELNRLAAKLRTLYLNSAENQYIYRAADELESLDAELTEIAKTEPVGAIYTIAGVQHCTITETMGDTDIFARPMPANRLTELKLLMLTTAYEQGVGKGIQRRDCNPYAANTDEYAAWALGYAEGLDKPMPRVRKAGEAN